MKSLSDTSVFKYSEMMGNNRLTSSISAIIDPKYGGSFVNETQLEDVFYKIRHKSFNFMAKFGVIELFRKNVIKLAYSENVKLSVAVPFFTYKMSNGGFGVIINISNYATKNANDGSINMDPLTLYALMLAGAYSLQITQRYQTLVNGGLAEIYADMFVALCARMTNMDIARREKVKFVICKYMYIQLGLDESRASAAAGRSLRSLDQYSVEQIDLAFPPEVFQSLEGLIEYMRKVFVEFESITFGMIFDKWLKAYGEAAGFGLEYIPYFVLTFCALITNCNQLANVKAIEKEANKNSTKLSAMFNAIETTVQDLSNR